VSLDGSGNVNLGTVVVADQRHWRLLWRHQRQRKPQRGRGQEILTGDNTYTGGTTIGNGTDLLIGDQGTTGSIVGDVTNNGYLLFDRSDAITYNGVVSGSGGLYQYNATALSR
jgi:fibronectin-binding autotransporter adhesin